MATSSVGAEHMVVLENILDGMVMNVEKIVGNVEKDHGCGEDESSSDWSSDEEDEKTKRSRAAATSEDERGGTKKVDVDKIDEKSKKDKDEIIISHNEIVPTVSKSVEFKIEENDQFLPAGKVLSALKGSSVVVIQGLPDGETLCAGTVLCTEPDNLTDLSAAAKCVKVIGSIDELFGPVNLPHYIVRNARSDVQLEEGSTVQAVRRSLKVLAAGERIRMQQQRGTDASNIHDEENDSPTFSDDEEEREYKRKMKRQHGLDKRKRPTVGADRAHRGSRSNYSRRETFDRKRNRSRNAPVGDNHFQYPGTVGASHYRPPPHHYGPGQMMYPHHYANVRPPAHAHDPYARAPHHLHYSMPYGNTNSSGGTGYAYGNSHYYRPPMEAGTASSHGAYVPRPPHHHHGVWVPPSFPRAPPSFGGHVPSTYESAYVSPPQHPHFNNGGNGGHSR